MADIKKIVVERPTPDTLTIEDEGRKYIIKRDGKNTLVAREDSGELTEENDPFWTPGQ
jgi:hypothetical protein